MLDNEEYSHGRRRSVDVGGLALALENQGLGHGWGGWEEDEQGGTGYAELLSDMYNHTHTTVNHHVNDLSPIVIPDHTRARLIESLDSWHFEPHNLPEDEVLFCTLILFESLFRIEHMHEDIGVSLDDISVFLKHLRLLYCGHNSYHNFQHALDVLQASQIFLCAAGVVPPASILLESNDCTWRPDKSGNQGRLAFDLTNTCLFTLFIAAIGHDVGHPGLTNMFMKNAKAPLSAVYDDKSALEQMHYALLIQAMRHHGLGKLLDRPDSGRHFRKSLAGIVLATDMNIHSDFMRDFESLVTGRECSLPQRQLLLCQAIIKCADISNPSRPPGVSHYWASALTVEWTSQASLEKRYHLPPSVTPSNCPIGHVRGQIFFITKFAKPLMDLVAQAVPEMEYFAHQCTANLAMWEAHQELLSSPSAEQDSCPHVVVLSPRPPEDYLCSFPLTLPPFVLTPDEPRASDEWHSVYPLSDSSSDVSSDVHVEHPVILQSTSPPASPVPSVGSSCSLAPCSSSSSLASNTNDAAQTMRAAYSASVRKKRSFYHRRSWNASASSGSSPVISIPPPLLATIPKAALLVAKATASDGTKITSVTAMVTSRR